MKKTIFSLMFAFAMLFTFAFVAKAQFPIPDVTCTVGGFVVDFTTNAGFSPATIRLDRFNKDGFIDSQTFTPVASNGSYELELSTKRNYFVSVVRQDTSRFRYVLTDEEGFYATCNTTNFNFWRYPKQPGDPHE